MRCPKFNPLTCWNCICCCIGLTGCCTACCCGCCMNIWPPGLAITPGPIWPAGANMAPPGCCRKQKNCANTRCNRRLKSCSCSDTSRTVTREWTVKNATMHAHMHAHTHTLCQILFWLNLQLFQDKMFGKGWGSGLPVVKVLHLFNPAKCSLQSRLS